MKKYLKKHEIQMEHENGADFYVEISGEIEFDRKETDPGNPEFLGSFDYEIISQNVNIEKINELPVSIYCQNYIEELKVDICEYILEKLPDWYNDPTTEFLNDIATICNEHRRLNKRLEEL